MCWASQAEGEAAYNLIPVPHALNLRISGNTFLLTGRFLHHLQHSTSRITRPASPRLGATFLRSEFTAGPLVQLGFPGPCHIDIPRPLIFCHGLVPPQRPSLELGGWCANMGKWNLDESWRPLPLLETTYTPSTFQYFLRTTRNRRWTEGRHKGCELYPAGAHIPQDLSRTKPFHFGGTTTHGCQPVRVQSFRTGSGWSPRDMWKNAKRSMMVHVNDLKPETNVFPYGSTYLLRRQLDPPSLHQ